MWGVIRERIIATARSINVANKAERVDVLERAR